MATVSDHQTLNCPLCFKTFITPRVLPCYHTFCEKCLGTHIESQIQDGKSFKCPLCAKITVPSDSSLAIDKWTSAFPLDTVVCSVIESMGVPENSDNTCEPCKTVGETEIAEFWCVNCKEKICSSCNESHKRIKLLKHHTTVLVEEMDQHLQSNINFDQKCGRHRGKNKELFCIDHRELCCAVCVATDHRQCNDVRSIDDMARDQSHRSTFDYPSIIRDVRKLKSEMEKIMSEKNHNATQMLQEKNQIVHDTGVRIDKIIEHLNKLKIAFEKETEKLYKDTITSIQNNETIAQRFMTNIDNSNHMLELVEKIGSPQQKLATFLCIHDQMALHYHQLYPLLKDDVEMHLNEKPDKVLTDLETTLHSLGTVAVSTKSCTASRDVLQGIDRIVKKLDSRTKISTEMCAAQVQKSGDLMMSPVTFVKAVQEEKFGGMTVFTGGAYLADGRLVMADNRNNRLVVLDDEYNFVKGYKLDDKPTDVVVGNKNNEIYIAVNRNYICKCTLRTDLIVVSKIKAPTGTVGVAFNGDNIIVGTPSAVVILTQDGSTVKSIPKSGRENFLTVSETQRNIYHKDNDDIVCRTWEGQEVFRYQHQQLEEPCGICQDNNNNLYVCGIRSRNVHQISSDGQRSRIILDKLRHISHPYCVMLHPQKNELIVTSCYENTVFEVYKLG